MPKRIDTILSEGLVEKGLISKDAADQILKEAQNSDKSFKELLLGRKILPEHDILIILSEKLHLPFIELKQTTIEKSAIARSPFKISSYYKFMPVVFKDRVLSIAVAYPLDVKIQDEIITQLGCDISVNLACESDISDALKKYYGLGAETIQSINVADSDEKGSTIASLQEKIEDIEKLATDASVIKLVNQIILEAYRKRATDIHIEPYRKNVSLRYRIDGVLYDAHVPAEIKNFLNAIISRIKIMSNLNIVERRLPQDGRAVVRVQEQVLDLRISTIPTPFGESVVIRILPTQMLFSLEKLGLAKNEVDIFEKLILKPHGIIFVTGPTGSGKTTTLYTCLSRINTKDRKIITIEDPIEYEMPGITQIQVMPEIGLTFSTGLRSMLRHDPDVIMVGEVRDLETAEIAIRVSLTGHIIFSTLHTNDAPSGIARLLDIGLEPYLLASTVEAFVAQRLIRVICQDCKYEDTAAPLELKTMIAHDLGISVDGVKIYRGKGCSACNFTGFLGRTAIYEILVVNEIIKNLILKKAAANDIKKVAVSGGMHTLRQNGWNKVISGETSPEEVMKVTTLEEVSGEGATFDSAQAKQDKQSFDVPVAQPSKGNVPGAKIADKRIYNRLDSKVNLHYTLIKPEDAIDKKGFALDRYGQTANISAGGLLFISDEKIDIGSIIEMHLELPDGSEKPIECLARVVRIEEIEPEHKYNIAVCFLDITGTERGRLNKFVQR
ncbi:MAG: ATPase, T2SS/T4P/T4SS family [Candidatus Omnitrophica bacterium]|nr:ATPase, T2SS/T4P/T4SS family [Candidatus Omnitrophota bacterium]